MEVVINTIGTTIRKKGERFEFETDGNKQEFSVKKIERILVSTSAKITTDAIILAIENEIDLIFNDKNGHPIGRVWSSKLGSIVTIRRKQLKLIESKEGYILGRNLIKEKIENQMSLLKKLKLNRKMEKINIINEAVSLIEKGLAQIDDLEYSNMNDARWYIEGIEGYCSRIYFRTLGDLIPIAYKFTSRSRRPAKDEFNAMLNYSYGILYSLVERACINAGIDPYIGIIHTDNYNKKSMIFDLIEPYRAYIDEIVFRLFSTRKIKSSMFNGDSLSGYFLGKEGKGLLSEILNIKLNERIKYKNKFIKLKNIIQFDCHNIAKYILSEVM